MSNEYDAITGGEFGRFRVDFNARIADLGERMDTRFDTVDEKFDNLNGRTRTQAEAVIRLDGRVAEIATRGCGQLLAHRATLDALPLAERAQGWREWHPAAKAGAGVGVMSVMALLLELLQRLMQHFGV